MSRPSFADRHIGFSMVALVAFVAAVAVVSFRVFPAQAAGVTAPYEDKQATGFLTLYDKNGTAIKSGSVTDKPFVWKAAGSQAAAAPYDKTGHKATLMAYQPREGVQPSDWSGDTLTASTAYADVKHPAAQATADDFTLKDFLDEFPPKWDGMVELRLYLSAPGVQAQSTGYASTDIKVTGTTWVVIGGGPGAGTGGANIPGKVGAAAQAALDGKPSASASAAPSASNSAAAVGNADTSGGGNAAVLQPAALTELPYLRTPGYLLVAGAVLIAFVFAGVLVRRRHRYTTGEWA